MIYVWSLVLMIPVTIVILLAMGLSNNIIFQILLMLTTIVVSFFALGWAAHRVRGH